MPGRTRPIASGPPCSPFPILDPSRGTGLAARARRTDVFDDGALSRGRSGAWGIKRGNGAVGSAHEAMGDGIRVGSHMFPFWLMLTPHAPCSWPAPGWDIERCDHAARSAQVCMACQIGVEWDIVFLPTFARAGGRRKPIVRPTGLHLNRMNSIWLQPALAGVPARQAGRLRHGTITARPGRPRDCAPAVPATDGAARGPRSRQK